ncbi:TetR/AcrR family transcriptional regulator [Allosphingosinicella deserti]|nr:TetR/AcrR family transcriptional regulator [Sphingomonas deserti]
MVDARIGKTRAALAAAMLELIAERDFSAITVADIVAKADVGYATFFRHYQDKEGLLFDAADRLIDELLPTMLPALRDEDTRSASIALCRFINDRKAICRALFAGGAEPQVRRILTERSMARAETTGLPDPPGLPFRLAITHSVRATLGILAWWFDEAPDMDCEEVGAIIDRLVIAPVRKG